MAETERPGHGEKSQQGKRGRYGPLRSIMPWIAIVAGILVTVRFAFTIGTGASNDLLFFIFGLIMIVAGIVAFFVYRWMANRNI